ncbi:MAG: nucleotidyltransferase family protein [Lentisphaeria bacterium]|nr:nucleotidyltransferase family protein [Lentisphaeria bacterium]
MSMDRKTHIFEVFEMHRQDLLDIGVKAIGIFGSVVRGDDSAESDCDILVEFEEQHRTFKNFNRLCDFIEEYVTEDYDLVTRQGLSPYLGNKILEEVEYAQIAS